MKTRTMPLTHIMNGKNIGGMPLNETDIPQSLLNIENKDRSNIFPWRGQFSPQFVETILEKYSSINDEVLDPFAGSGTVLYEAGRKKLRASASEINPAAYRMASTYRLINEHQEQRNSAVSILDNALKKIFPSTMPLFGSQSADEDKIKESLITLDSELPNELSKILLESLIIRLDLYQPGLNQEKVMLTWERLKTIVSALPFSPEPLRVFNCDARELPLPESTIDLVVTSPPYINVFNYHQQYRASAEALGWNLLQVAKSEIGSNRKHRGNRFLTVIQYCLDLSQSLSKLATVCKPSARIIFIVGRESRVRGVPFYNGQIVSLLGMECIGFDMQMRQERVFKNKFGELIYEDILHFINPSAIHKDAVINARGIARFALEEARASAQDDVLEDIQDALDRLNQVEPSPVYCPDAAFNGKATSEERHLNPA